MCFMGGLKVLMGTLAHVQPRKTLSEKNLPVLGSFLSMPVFQLRTFFFWKVNIRSRYEKYPDLGPQIPGF